MLVHWVSQGYSKREEASFKWNCALPFWGVWGDVWRWLCELKTFCLCRRGDKERGPIGTSGNFYNILVTHTHRQTHKHCCIERQRTYWKNILFCQNTNLYFFAKHALWLIFLVAFYSCNSYLKLHKLAKSSHWKVKFLPQIKLAMKGIKHENFYPHTDSLFWQHIAGLGILIKSLITSISLFRDRSSVKLQVLPLLFDWDPGIHKKNQI